MTDYKVFTYCILHNVNKILLEMLRKHSPVVVDNNRSTILYLYSIIVRNGIKHYNVCSYRDSDPEGRDKTNIDSCYVA